MTLREYRRRRDPARTPEPFAEKPARRAGAPAFVVQKHDASQLHFDLRLEIDGSLRSWAVPKGPSLVAGTARLAVAVEDHPLAYAAFEGVIPQGQYGGGTVMLWDRGTWTSLDGDPARSLASGTLRFELHGERLRGGWRLVRRAAGHSGKAGAQTGSKVQWLLLKRPDAFSSQAEAPSNDLDRSVATGRTMQEIAEGAPKRSTWRKRNTTFGPSPPVPPRVGAAAGVGTLGRRGSSGLAGQTSGSSAPPTIAPQLASLVSTPPTGDEWSHEVKLDGYRMLAHLERGAVRLLSRNGLDWTARFPAIRDALPRVKGSVLDGEMVVRDAEGISRFQRLQEHLRRGAATPEHSPIYVLFDLPWWDGVDLRSTPLDERRALLEQVTARIASPSIALSERFDAAGVDLLRAACRLGLEGVVSKRRDSPYQSGRTRSWLKSKCALSDEFAVVGMTAGGGARTGFGALLLARPREGALRYAGRVGAGFNEAQLTAIAGRLRRSLRARPSVEGAPTTSGALWCSPKLVVEVGFAGVTRDGLLRQPVFKGIREDKHMRDLIDDANRSSAVEADSDPPRRRAGSSSGDVVAGVRITHPERAVFVRPTISKLAIARYYEAAAPQLLRFVGGRPLSLLRCPDGVPGTCFVQKHFRDALPDGVRRVADAGGTASLVIEDERGVVGLVQRGVVEIHAWGCHAETIERPDLLVLDLDPGPGVPWSEVRRAARLVRDVLARAELVSAVRTSGGKGLHVAAAPPRGLGWPEFKQLAKGIADAVVALEPDRFTSVASLSRRRGRIFIDWMRNARGATAVASWSLRARAGAPVAMPLSWQELGRVPAATHFTIDRARRRLARPVEE